MEEKCKYCGKINCICGKKEQEEHHNHEHGCEHGHCHSATSETKKTDFYFYILAIIIFILSFTVVKQEFRMISYLIVILLAGYELLLDGIRNFIKLNFEESTLMTIAVMAAFVLGEYPEACLVVLLFRVGEFLEDKISQKSQKNIEEIVKIKAETANVLNEKEEVTVTPSQKVKVGETILIKPGEKVPLDAIIISGDSSMDTSAITGESNPVSVSKKDQILSGSINLSGAVIARVERDYHDSTASQIVDLVYEATNNKGETEKFITKFSKVYTPIVMILALILAVVPPLFTGFDFANWIMRSLIFLVASCPCSIVISIPLAMFSGVGAISKKGLLLKGTKYIENLSKVNVIAFDKTGTLTTGQMQLDKVEGTGNYDKEKLMQYIVNLENLSSHPISKAFIGEKVEKLKIENYKEIAGHGIYCEIEEKQVILGNKKLLQKYQVNMNNIKEASIYLAIDKRVEGLVYLKEKINEGNNKIVEQLKKENINRVIMLTGDNKEAANKIGDTLNISEIYAELLPQEKRKIIENLKNEKQKVIFIGDGINDGPVLASADLGISMGQGTHIANNISDGILMTNNLNVLPNCIHTAKKTIRISKFNIMFSLLIKLFVLILGILGIAPIWSAILADTGVTILTVMNSIRIIKGE